MKFDGLGIALFSSLCIGTFGLGCWQIQRYFEKVNIIQQDDKLIRESPTIFTPGGDQESTAEKIRRLQGKVISLSGTFDHTKEVLLGIRSAPPDLLSARAEGMATNPQGYYIITPMILADKSVVFVNRGWVSMRAKEWQRPIGKITINVVASQCEKPATFSPRNDPFTKKLLWLEDAALVAATDIKLSLSNIAVAECIETDDNAIISSFPAVKKIKTISQHYVTPETHAVYAFTWFSLCAFGMVGTYYKFAGGRSASARAAVLQAKKIVGSKSSH